MPQNIIKSAKSIVMEAMAAVPAIDVAEAISLLNSDDHVFVDLQNLMISTCHRPTSNFTTTPGPQQ